MPKKCKSTQDCLKATKFHSDMLETLLTCHAVLGNKRQDYGDDNFVKAAKVAGVLTGKKIEPMDVAACLVGIKFARYGNLTSNSKTPLHEPLKDTVIDGVNYVVLMERERQKSNAETRQEKETDT